MKFSIFIGRETELKELQFSSQFLSVTKKIELSGAGKKIS